MKQACVAVALLALVAISVSDQAHLAAQSGTSVVISEFRTRGPLGGNDEFVELFNPTAAPVDISGWKIRGSNASGTVGDRATVPAATTLGPGCFFLATNAGASGYSGAVPGNLTYTTGVTDDGGLALTHGDNTIVDQIGMSVGSAFGEGTRLATFGSTNTDRAYARTPTPGTDSDDNATDVVMTSPSGPQNLATVAGCSAPPVDQGSAVIWPHDVQGSGNGSPLVGQMVAVRGIVTAKRFNNGFFIQTPDAPAALEGDPATSEGLFVFTSVAPAVNIGDDVIVTGTVTEFIPSADPHQPSVTEITAPVVSVQATGQPLPGAIVLTPLDVSPTGGPLQLERYEGMRVTADGLTVVAPTGGSVNEANATGSNNGVFYAVFTGTPRPFREPGIDVIDPAPPCDEHAAGACAIPVFDANPERLRVDSDGQVGVFPGAVVSTGASLNIASGVLDYAFRTWTILPDAGALTIGSAGMSPQAVPPRAAGEYLVASFNLERFFDTTADPAKDDPVLTATAYANRLAKASLIVRDYLQAPDIVGVQEAENLTVLQDLAAKIDTDAAAAGQPAPGYQAFLEEGHDIGGIDVGVLVRANVTVHSVTQWRTDETFIDPSDGSIDLLNDRPSLVLDATVAGPPDRLPAHVVVVVNHLRSLNGADDAADGRRVRAKRKAQAESVAQLLIDLQSQYPSVPIVSVGDYNAFDVNDGYVDVLGIIRGDQAPPEQVVDWSPLGLNAHVVEALSPGEYSYSFDGNAQTLDHVLMSSVAATLLSGIHHARIDADFPEAFRADAARPERLSDHDPAVARFAFPADTVPPVFGDVANITVEATSFNGANVTYDLPTATDNLDATVPVDCVPPPGSFFPLGATAVTCTAIDVAGNIGMTSFLVTVKLVDDDAGLMAGLGQVTTTARVTFAFIARQGTTGAERGSLELLTIRPRALPITFVSEAVDDVVFLGTAVRFSGRGRWNGQRGFTFVVEAADNGEPGAGRDLFGVIVRGPQGNVVAQIGGTLNAGNIEKVR